MKARLVCFWLALACAWAHPREPRIRVREYRIGPVTHPGPYPVPDLLAGLPDSIREILRTLPQDPPVDTAQIRKLDSSVHVAFLGPNGNSDPFYSVTLRGRLISSRIRRIGIRHGDGKDFLLVLTVDWNDLKIIRANEVYDWDRSAHGWTLPIPTRDGLITVDTVGILRHADDTAHFVVRKNGKELYRFQVCDPVREQVLGFSALGNKWILQTWNHLVVDGRDMNKRIGSEEVFNGRAFAGGLFYFAKAKGGAYRAYRNGIPIGRGYDHVPHDLCCGSAMANVWNSESRIRFYAARKGMWYLVLIESA